MASEVWLPLNADERNLLLKALASHAREDNHKTAMALSRKIATAAPYPDITIGVHGGLVQWTLGNPLPVRLYDYDIDGVGEPDFDEDGRACVVSEFEPKPA